MIAKMYELEKAEKRVAAQQAAHAAKQRQVFQGLQSGYGMVMNGVARLTATLGILKSTLIAVGFAGTTHGEAFGAQFNRMTKAVASIFVPEMEKLIEIFRKATNFLFSLNGEQQQAIAHTIKTAFVFGILTTTLTKLIPILMGAFRWFKAVAAAQLGMQAIMAGPIAGIAVFATGLGILAASSAIAEKGLDALSDSFDSLGNSAGRSFKTLEEAVAHVKANRGFWEEAGGALRGGAENVIKGFGLFGELRTREGDIENEAKSLMGPKAKSTPTRVQETASGTEAITATIQRLQDASLKQDYQRQIAALNEELVAGMKVIVEFIKAKGLGGIGGLVKDGVKGGLTMLTGVPIG